MRAVPLGGQGEWWITVPTAVGGCSVALERSAIDSVARPIYFRHSCIRYSMPRQDRPNLFPGALEMMVLQTLRLGPLHGYALAQAIKRASDDLVRVDEGALYPALQRMLKAGWLT